MNMRPTTTYLAAAIAVAGLWLTAAGAQARTIELRGEAFDRAAVLDARYPDISWVGIRARRGDIYTTSSVDLRPNKTFLVRYDLENAVPEGMRVTRAIWVLPVTEHSPDRVRLEVWRMIGNWGPGVSHEHRARYPEPTLWAEPGGRGPGTDRALSATATTTVNETGEVSVNVTRDVELWQTGAAPNHGWMITVEDQGALVQFPSPIWTARDDWKLRITYEPE